MMYEESDSEQTQLLNEDRSNNTSRRTLYTSRSNSGSTASLRQNIRSNRRSFNVNQNQDQDFEDSLLHAVRPASVNNTVSSRSSIKSSYIEL